MKYYSLLFLLAMLFTGFASEEEANDDVIEVQALKLDGSLADQLRKMQYVEAFTVDRDEVLRPQKDYRLVFYKTVEKFILAPATENNMTNVASDNFEKVELDNGVEIHCYCMDGNDDCTFDNVRAGEFKCSGSCSCGIGMIISPGKNIPEYQTAEGDWFPTKDF